MRRHVLYIIMPNKHPAEVWTVRDDMDMHRHFDTHSIEKKIEVIYMYHQTSIARDIHTWNVTVLTVRTA